MSSVASLRKGFHFRVRRTDGRVRVMRGEHELAQAVKTPMGGYELTIRSNQRRVFLDSEQQLDAYCINRWAK